MSRHFAVAAIAALALVLAACGGGFRRRGRQGTGLREGAGGSAEAAGQALRPGEPAAARRHRRVRPAAHRAARLSGGGQQVGLVVRPLPRGDARGSSSSPPASASGSRSSASTATTPAQRPWTSCGSSQFPIRASATPTRRSPTRWKRRSASRRRRSTTRAASFTTSSRASTRARRPRRRHQALRALGPAREPIRKADNGRMRGRRFRLVTFGALALTGAALVISPALAKQAPRR